MLIKYFVTIAYTDCVLMFCGVQLNRATVHNTKTGQLETANYRISKRWIFFYIEFFISSLLPQVFVVVVLIFNLRIHQFPHCRFTFHKVVCHFMLNVHTLLVPISCFNILLWWYQFDTFLTENYNIWPGSFSLLFLETILTWNSISSEKSGTQSETEDSPWGTFQTLCQTLLTVPEK